MYIDVELMREMRSNIQVFADEHNNILISPTSDITGAAKSETDPGGPLWNPTEDEVPEVQIEFPRDESDYRVLTGGQKAVQYVSSRPAVMFRLITRDQKIAVMVMNALKSHFRIQLQPPPRTEGESEEEYAEKFARMQKSVDSHWPEGVYNVAHIDSVLERNPDDLEEWQGLVIFEFALGVRSEHELYGVYTTSN